MVGSAWITQRFRATAVSACSLTAQQFSVPARYRLELKDRVTEPDRQEAHHDGEHHVGSGIKPFPVTCQVQRLQAEGRERGVTSAKASHNEPPRGDAHQRPASRI